MSMGPSTVLEEGPNPLLNLLVKSLHALFTVIINLSQRPIIKILSALKSIFKHCDLKFEVISLLKENTNVPEIINFMQNTTMVVESQQHTYKLSECFLSFITEVFS